MSDAFSSIDDALDALAQGRVIIVVDDEDRENEGDFVAAADRVTPEIVEFMIREGRGLLCMPILPETAERLRLDPMVDNNTAPQRTAYTIPIDHKSCRTGISAEERARTIRAVIDSTTKPADFVRPGHVFPLVAKEGGVLRRAGHTEAAVDLARLAGLTPAGVICEITEGIGMADRRRLHEIARTFDLPIVSIEALIKYRRRRERLVERVAEAQMPTRYGRGRVIGYKVQFEPLNNPLAFTVGDLTSVHAPLVRIHSSCFTGDLLDSLRCDCGDQLHMALEMIAEEGVGALIYLPQEGRGIGLIEKIKAYNLQDKGRDTVQANEELGYRADLRDYGVGLQILKDLGLSKVRLLTNNPKKTDAFVYDGYDLSVVDQVPIIAPDCADRRRYLETKRDKLGHKLPGGKPAAGNAPSARSSTLLAGLLAVFLMTAPAPAAQGQVEPQARALLEDLVVAARETTDYADEGLLRISAPPESRTKPLEWPLKLARQSPGRLRLDLGQVQVFSDGQDVTISVPALKQYHTSPAKGPLLTTLLGDNPAGSMIRGGPAGPLAEFVLRWLVGPADGLDPIAGLTSARLEPDRPVPDGAPLRVVRCSDGGPVAFLVYIDPATRRLARIEMIPDPPSEQPPALVSWEPGPVRTEPQPPETFAFQPAAGQVKLEGLDVARGAKPAPDEPHPLVGKPAPQFTLSVLEADGKSRRVTRDELVGKVVILDFWATWCGPCLRELPEIARLVEKWNGEGLGVVVVAVSLDREPRAGAEGPSARARIESTLKDRQIAIDRPPVGLVASDPSQAIAQVFEVEGLPTLVLLDPAGTVRAVHLGFDEEIAQTLDREVRALLQGQPLEPGTEPKPAADAPAARP